jgi:hypothetical protein
MRDVAHRPLAVRWRVLLRTQVDVAALAAGGRLELFGL